MATLAELFRHQRNFVLSNLLDNAKPRIVESGYDGIDGGQYYFTLHLDLPLKIFAPIQNEIQKSEEWIANTLSAVLRDTGNLHLSSVTISPMLEQPTQTGQQVAPVDYEHLWEKGMLRLFLSHVSAHKENVAKLKAVFHSYGISAFVAHEDIEPNSLWQGEIELALKSMDALVALLTPDFHQSNWTDQEVGYALGRNVVVIPVRLGQDPYGFIGKLQGLAAGWEWHHKLVSEVVDLLLKNKTTAAKVRESLVFGLENASNFANAKSVIVKLQELDYFSPEQLERIKNAYKNNGQVNGSYGARERINKILDRFKPAIVEEPIF